MTYIIAEVGVNHLGNEYVAHELIERASEAGADAVKFQAFTPSELDPPGSRRDMLKGMTLPLPAYARLKRRCDDNKVDFVVTPFSPYWVEAMEDLEPDYLKVASGHLDNEPLLDRVFQTEFRVIVSTGMAYENDIHQFMAKYDPTVLMHCVSAYPCAVHDANLKALDRYRTLWGSSFRIGYSDHTQSTLVPALAKMRGAEFIEKHIGVGGQQGPDACVSLNPTDFKWMVDCVRVAERAMGRGDKDIQTCEQEAYAAKLERDKWRKDGSTS